MIDKYKVYYKLTDEQLKDQDPDFKTKYIYIGITEVKLFKRSLGLVLEADACQLVDDMNNLIFCKFTGKQDINGLDLFDNDRILFWENYNKSSASGKPDTGDSITGVISYNPDLMVYYVSDCLSLTDGGRRMDYYLIDIHNIERVNNFYEC